MIMANKEKNEKEKKLRLAKFLDYVIGRNVESVWKNQDLLVYFYKIIGSPNFKTQKLYNFKIKKLKVHNIT